MPEPQAEQSFQVGHALGRLRDALDDRGMSAAFVPSRYVDVYFDAQLRREDAQSVQLRAMEAVKRARFGGWEARKRTERASDFLLRSIRIVDDLDPNAH
jgi:hypothetical protein